MKLGRSYDGNGVTENTNLDTFGRISGMTYNKSGTSLDGYNYSYDRNGNVLYKQNLVSAKTSSRR